MIGDFLSSPMGLGVAVGFVAGSFGYILARFWFRPLLAYLSIKRKVAAALTGADREKRLPGAEDLRRWAAALTDCYHDTLPQWYKLALANREESPEEAARHLMALAGVKKTEQAAGRIKKIRFYLKIK